MILYRDFVKIIKQVNFFGAENAFGYRTTLANQLYLMHVLLGKIYWTDKLHWPIKMVYSVPILCQLCIGIILCVLYSIHGIRGDFILFTQIGFLILLMIYLTFIVPLACRTFSNDIETMIDLVDDLLTSRSSKCDLRHEGIIDIKTSLIVDFFVFCVPLLVYVSAGTCDVTMFYEEEKVKNFIYYTTPFPNIREYGSLEFFLFVNIGIAFVVGSVPFIQLWCIVAMPFVWAAICHNEVVCICHDLKISCTSGDVKQAAVEAAKAYQKVRNIIRNFRRFYNVLCTVTLVQLLLVAIANAYVVLLWDIPYLAKIRGTSAVLVCTTMILQLCSVGEIINDLTNFMSREIYSIPWYWSTKNRRDVHFALCQAQTTFDLSAFKVYPFQLRTVLRFVNVVYTSANYLRKATQK